MDVGKICRNVQLCISLAVSGMIFQNHKWVHVSVFMLKISASEVSEKGITPVRYSKKFKIFSGHRKSTD
jgi:hypothetical protein